MTTQKGRAGQILGAMFSGRGTSLGVRMTKQIKKVGSMRILRRFWRVINY